VFIKFSTVIKETDLIYTKHLFYYTKKTPASLNCPLFAVHLHMNNSFISLGKLLDNKYRLIHHILFIGLILLFWFLFTITSLNFLSDFVKYLLYSSTYLIIAYFNIYFLFQRFMMRGKILLYILFSVITFVMSYVSQKFIYFKDWEQFFKEFDPTIQLLADMMINAITYCMFIGIGLSVKMIKMWLSSQQKVVMLEQENLKATLANLKSQISPHFLFNTFNNLYVLTKTKPNIAAEMILGLSDLMRYQLTECDQEKVAIEKEINYIDNFLTLEKLRKDKLDVRISYDKTNVTGIMIEPLLFITLVENAVKHGSQQLEDPFIHINLYKSYNTFVFEVINSKPEISLLGKEKSLGKGITTLKKRLSLAYPERHSLELINSKNRFSAKLLIELT
jgi:two-component system, LytTR family, sensor kinase